MSLKNTHAAKSLAEYSDYRRIKKWSKKHASKLTRRSATIELNKKINKME